MLKPHERQHLRETLRPPSGFTLDYAIGTTFSLDLFTLLTAPIAFTFFDLEDADSASTEEVGHLELFETMRRYARRLAIFTQAGQIYPPKRPNLLFSYLEPTVTEVMAPIEHGIFHPKIWVLRYTNSEQRVCYRLLCKSRNLTFDRSWDTVLVLDGELRGSQLTTNTSVLADFINLLPTMAVGRQPDEDTQANVARIAAELRNVHFSPPPGFTQLTFQSLGVDGKASWPFTGRIDRLLVISPFLSPATLARLAGTRRGNILVSEDHSLAGLGQRDLVGYEQVYILDPITEAEDPAEHVADDFLPAPLQGLHAKLYIADSGDEGRIWTGSANATEAAFSRNVEFLVELRGPRTKCGIDAILGRASDAKENADRNPTLRDLLREYSPPTSPEPADTITAELERRIEQIRRAIATEGLTCYCVAEEKEDRYFLELRTNGGRRPIAAVEGIRCWPITLGELHASQVDLFASCIARLGPLSLETITSFIAFEVRITYGQRTMRQAFVLNLPLINEPEGRQAHLIRVLLRDPRKVLRFLLLLLADDQPDIRNALDALSSVRGGTADGSSNLPEIPLFEIMMRALAEHPEKLDTVASFIAELRKTEEGNALLPARFDTIWQPIWNARQRRRR